MNIWQRMQFWRKPVPQEQPSILDVEIVTEKTTPVVAIDVGPVRLTEIATEELLSDDITAAHYQVGALDAEGKVITLGSPMTYLAWGGKKTPRVDEYCVYRLKGKRFIREAGFSTREAAEEFAKTLTEEN